MKLYNICSKRTYQKDGQDKTVWLNVGTFKETDEGKKFIELNILPTTPLYVFEREKKEEPKQEEFGG